MSTADVDGVIAGLLLGLLAETGSNRQTLSVERQQGAMGRSDRSHQNQPILLHRRTSAEVPVFAFSTGTELANEPPCGTFADPAGIAAPLRGVVRGIDANQPIYNVRTFSSFYEQRAISVAMTLMQVVATMGLLGLRLALVGLYGLIAYSVSRRTQEIGIRMAIGADKMEVLKMVLRQGFVLVAAGIAVGGVISVVVVRMLAIGLACLGTPNPITYVVVPIALLLIRLAACYIPARRASLIDPILALRYE